MYLYSLFSHVTALVGDVLLSGLTAVLVSVVHVCVTKGELICSAGPSVSMATVTTGRSGQNGRQV